MRSVEKVLFPQVEGPARQYGGKLPEAIATFHEGLENWTARGEYSPVPFLRSALAEALTLQREVVTVLGLIDECLE